MFKRKAVNLIRRQSHRVRDNYLFPQTVTEPFDSITEAGQIRFSYCQLLLNIVVLYNRACNQLRKKRNVKRQIPQILLSLVFPSPHIYHIGHGLEGIKGNADRKSNISVRQHFFSKQTVANLQKEIKVFKIA